MYLPNHATDDFLEFSHTSEIITLKPEYFAAAIENSKNFANTSTQWQIYWQNLAFLAFSAWLNKREPTVSIHQAELLAWQSQYSYVIDAAFNVSIGKFKVCLIPTITLSYEEVTVPRAVIDLPEFNAHFYVVIGINEELELATIRGFLRYDQIVKYQAEFTPELDWNYHLPLSCFNSEPDELLLYLQCLSPTAITLPEIKRDRQNILATIQSEILNLLPQLHNSSLWKVLTWEQGVAVLTAPDLLNWLAQSTKNKTSAFTQHLPDLLQILTQPAVNVRFWLHNQLDQVIPELSWRVLAPLTPLLRTEQTPEQELENILTDIQRTYKIDIPKVAGRAYQELKLENPLRLYAVTWSLPDENPGWNLLLILKTIPGNYPTSGFTLRVSDKKDVLVEEKLQTHHQQEYIFTLIEGSYDDQFLVNITSTNGQTQTLPPLEFTRE